MTKSTVKMNVFHQTKVIILDSDALIALINEEDTLHQRAIRTRDELARQKITLVVSRYIIAETATFLALRVNRQVANKFLKDMNFQNISILESNEELEKLTREYFFKQKSRKATFFDCVNMAFLKHYQWKAIFSFDKHYKQNNFLLASELFKT